jgi:hypothetical protein
MRNIYGTTATGQINNMSGGFAVPKISFKSYAEMRPIPNVRFLDENNQTSNVLPLSAMFGGAGKKKTRKKRIRKKNKNLIK